MPTLKDLPAGEDSAWPRIQGWLREAHVPVEILPPSSPAREASLEWLQAATRSELGAIAYETGGLLVDHGWLRILAAGHPRLPRSILDWNRGRTWTESTKIRTHILVADDVMGGLFAVNCGGLGFLPGEIGYFRPDTLRWESTDMMYPDFLRWSWSGRLAPFYRDCRWKGWERDVSKLDADQAFSLYPFTAGAPLSRRGRDRVPIAELYVLYQNLTKHVEDAPEGKGQAPR